MELMVLVWLIFLCDVLILFCTARFCLGLPLLWSLFFLLGCKTRFYCFFSHPLFRGRFSLWSPSHHRELAILIEKFFFTLAPPWCYQDCVVSVRWSLRFSRQSHGRHVGSMMLGPPLTGQMACSVGVSWSAGIARQKGRIPEQVLPLLTLMTQRAMGKAHPSEVPLGV